MWGNPRLFNRFLGRRLAIVDDTPGVTRDRNFARADWAGRSFFVVDTGGVIEDSDEPLDRAVREQAMAAVQEADVILFVVDGKIGIHPLDQKLAEILRKSPQPVLLVVNKLDNLPQEQSHLDFWALGMGEPHPVSATSGKASGDLLDAVVAKFPEAPEDEEGEGTIRVAVIGKPNVGKSSFVNRILGEERVVVSAIPGTTRDPVDTPMQYHGRTLIFVDTAGLQTAVEGLELSRVLQRPPHSPSGPAGRRVPGPDRRHGGAVLTGSEGRGAGVRGGCRDHLDGEQVGPGGEGDQHRSRPGEADEAEGPIPSVDPDPLHVGPHRPKGPEGPGPDSPGAGGAAQADRYA